MNNFAALVAIISGLNHEYIRKSMKRSWSRVGIWEQRVFDDLCAFCTREDDFRYIRRAIAAIVDAKPVQDDKSVGVGRSVEGGSSGHGHKSKASGDGKAAAPTSCIPFIGEWFVMFVR